MDEELEAEPEDYVGEGGADEQGANAEDPDQVMDDKIVPSGDSNGAGQRKGMTVKALQAKKIPNEKRTTTPYMTKYEKARVLGTRALQIRYGSASAA